MDLTCCCFFLIQWCIEFYVAQHKWLFLVKMEACLKVVVFLPVITAAILDWPEETILQILLSLSRYCRVSMFAIVLLRTYKLGKTEVDRQMYSIILTLLLLIYISTGIFSEVENQQII